MTDEERAWAMSERVLNFIRSVLPKGSTILELGSGWSTGELAKDYTMFSIEENEAFIGKYKSTYTHAPIVNGWYDVQALKGGIPNSYDLLLVDGPVRMPEQKQGRWGFGENLNLFKRDIIWIIDDVQHKDVLDMVTDISLEIHKTPFLFPTYDSRIFGVFK